MDIFSSIFTTASIIIIVLILFYFIYPFLRSFWVKPSMLFWGFYIGSRKKNNLTHMLNEITASSNNSPPPLDQVNNFIQDVISKEESYINDNHSTQNIYFENRLRKCEESISKHSIRTQQRRKDSKEGFFGLNFSHIDNSLRTLNYKNIVLLIIVLAIVYVDALIARHIFTSLGLFTSESLNLFGIRLPSGFPILYGAFITIVLAGFMHFSLQIEFLQNVFFEKKGGRIVVLSIITLLFTLLLFAILIPDLSKIFIEIAMRIAWLLGVIIVYWLSTKIIGKNEEYDELILPITLLLLLIGWLIFGIVFIIQLLIGSLFDIIAQTLFSVNKARISKKHDNELVRFQSLKQGFRRGFLL